MPEIEAPGYVYKTRLFIGAMLSLHALYRVKQDVNLSKEVANVQFQTIPTT